MNTGRQKGSAQNQIPVDKYPCHCYTGFDKDICQNDKNQCQKVNRVEKAGLGRRERRGMERKVDLMPLYNRLKEYRARLGVNQQEMGRLVGVSRQTISLIERGDYSPSITLALKLAKACRASVEELFWYEEDGNEEES